MPHNVGRAIAWALCAGAIAIMLGGCSPTAPAGTGTTTTTQNPELMLGRWMDAGRGIGYEFLAHREMVSVIKDKETTGTYRVSGNRVTMSVDEVSVEAAWKVDSGTLTLTIEGLPAATFKRE